MHVLDHNRVLRLCAGGVIAYFVVRVGAHNRGWQGRATSHIELVRRFIDAKGRFHNESQAGAS